jgi:4-hydroxy-tetrahydrodipicolinate synthase
LAIEGDCIQYTQLRRWFQINQPIFLLASVKEYAMSINWNGVFPAISTQFNDDGTINYPSNARMLEQLIDEGIEEAREIYRWFMPLLRLDTIPELVQAIKLAEQIVGRGSENVRAARLKLQGEERLC